MNLVIIVEIVEVVWNFVMICNSFVIEIIGCWDWWGGIYNCCFYCWIFNICVFVCICILILSFWYDFVVEDYCEREWCVFCWMIVFEGCCLMNSFCGCIFFFGMNGVLVCGDVCFRVGFCGCFNKRWIVMNWVSLIVWFYGFL